MDYSAEKFSWKWLMFILGVCIVAVAGIYGVFFYNQEGKTQQSEDMVGWRTYVSDQYGFEMKYPVNWNLHENEADPRFNIPAKSCVGFWYENSDGMLASIQIAGSGNNGCDAVSCPALEQANQIVTKKDVKIDGLTYSADMVSCPSLKKVDISIPNKSISSIKYWTNEYETSISEIEQVLSTFKFTASKVQAGADSKIVISDSSVMVINEGRTSQTIPFSEDALWLKSNYGGSNLVLANEHQDINFDGYNDLSVLSSSGYMGVNLFYTYYLFSPETKTFNETKLSICNPRFEPEEKAMYSSCKDGPTYLTTIYKFNGKEYVAGQTIDEFTKLPPRY